jgi:maltose-binding protein MalE
MIIDGPWMVDIYKKVNYPDFNYDFALIPAVKVEQVLWSAVKIS